MDDMKKCTQCGADLPAEAMFCSECGARQGGAEPAAPAATSAGMPEAVSQEARTPEPTAPAMPVPPVSAPQPAPATAPTVGLQYGMPAQAPMDPFANAPAPTQAPQPAAPASAQQPMQPGAYAVQQPPYPAQAQYPAQGMGGAPQQAWQTQAPYPGQTPPVAQPPAGKQAKAPKAPAQASVSGESGASAKKVPIPTMVLLGLSLVILVIWFLMYNSPNLPEFDYSAATANAAVFSFLLMSILAVVGAVLFRFQLRGKKLAVLGDVFIGIVMLVMLYGMSVTVLSENNLFYKLFIGITGG